MPELPKPQVPQLDPGMRQTIFNLLPQRYRKFPEPQLSHTIMQLFLLRRQRSQAPQGPSALSQQQQQQKQKQQQQQTQQQPDCFPQNPGVNMASNGSMFGNLGLKKGDPNSIVPGSQANAIASGLLMQSTTSLEQLEQRRQQQAQAHQNLQRALSGDVGAGMGGRPMNTGANGGELGLSGGSGSHGLGGGGGPGLATAGTGRPG
ncbi:hypothetical protein BJY52DRAFT_1284229 [Lactarius psammicola]|nr:hypothetical protein BJY52DRAFT_1284229 [Lactarius psammicola]